VRDCGELGDSVCYWDRWADQQGYDYYRVKECGEEMDEEGRESLHRLYQDALSGVHRIVPCTNLNVDILNSQVILTYTG